MAAPSSSAETWADRRSAARRQPAGGTEFRIEATPDCDANVGLVWNISTSGVSMLVGESRPCGELLRGRLITIHDDNPLPIAVRVVHIRQIETGDYFLGAQFERPLTAEEIRPYLMQ